MRVFYLILLPRFWAALVLATLFLGASGWLFSMLFLPKPLKFYNTSFITFAIPENWHCKQENLFFSCNEIDEGLHDATLLLTAKATGDHDSLNAYETHLNAERNMVDADGEEYASVVEAVERRSINEYEWVVGRHLGSEVRSYRTWYFATVTSQMSVLVTFSAHHERSQKYLDDVEILLNSLKLGQTDYE